jgi:predicted deacylase
MQRIIARPHELDLDAPGRRDYWVALEHDSIWGDHLMPLSVMVGPEVEAGRGLVAFGANHGNEYEGPMVVKHLLREIDPARVLGRIILVPVLNPAAFRAGARDSVLDDRVNLNRAFVDGAGAAAALRGITHRIARFVREAIWPRVHVVIDLHAGGHVARFVPCTSFHPLPDAEQARLIEQAARWFGTPVLLLYQNQTPGLLIAEAERLGKLAVGGEFGWGTAVQAEGVRYGRHGVLAAAIHSGQLSGAIAPIAHHAAGTQRLVDISDRACVSIAPFAGHFEPLVACGAMVAAGDVVGLLHDFDRIDEPPWQVTAGLDGMVVAQAWGAAVLQGQHIAFVGRIVVG